MIKEKIKLGKNTKYVLSIIAVLLIGYIVFEFYAGIIEKYNKKYQLSEKLISEKRYQGLSITNINIVDMEDTVSFSAKVTNKTEQHHDAENIKLVFLNKNGKKVCTITTELPDVGAQETSNMYAIIDKKCKEAYTFVIEK